MRRSGDFEKLFAPRMRARKTAIDSMVISTNKENMKKGTVKFFNEDKGFGFIVQDDGGKDLFVHVSEVTSGPITEGDTVEYEVGEGKKGPCAVNVRKAKG